MRTFFLTLLFLAWASVARWYYTCQIKQNCGEQDIVLIDTDERPQTLQLREGNRIIFQGYEQMRFDSAASMPDMTLDNEQFLDDVAAYLLAEPDKNLTIEGRFWKAENEGVAENSIYENIGLRRADYLRSLFERRDVDTRNRVFLDYVMLPKDQFKDYPVQFEISTRPVEEEPEPYQKLSFNFYDMTYTDANFEYNSDVFKPGSNFTYYADSVSIFLQQNPDATLTIIGHTDSVGGYEYNDDLGLRRAKNAGLYFEKELSVENKIKIETRGKREPVAPNDSEENRQKNRRVNIVIEQ